MCLCRQHPVGGVDGATDQDGAGGAEEHAEGQREGEEPVQRAALLWPQLRPGRAQPHSGAVPRHHVTDRHGNRPSFSHSLCL